MGQNVPGTKCPKKGKNVPGTKLPNGGELYGNKKHKNIKTR